MVIANPSINAEYAPDGQQLVPASSTANGSALGQPCNFSGASLDGADPSFDASLCDPSGPSTFLGPTSSGDNPDHVQNFELSPTCPASSIPNIELHSSLQTHVNLPSYHVTTRICDNTRKPKSFPNHVAFITETYEQTEPKTYNQAKAHPHWLEAMNKEHMTLLANQTWELVPCSSDYNVVGCKWVYKIKRRVYGSLERYKARLVVKGCHQEEGIDYFETFSPAVRPITIRLVLTIALTYGWPIRQLDVQNAFLHGALQKTVYMQQPPEFVNKLKPTHVCRLFKAIYGFKQSPCAWFHALSLALMSQGFKASSYDPSLFILSSQGASLIVLVYMDDIIVTNSSLNLFMLSVPTSQIYH